MKSPFLAQDFVYDVAAVDLDGLLAALQCGLVGMISLVPSGLNQDVVADNPDRIGADTPLGFDRGGAGRELETPLVPGAEDELESRTITASPGTVSSTMLRPRGRPEHNGPPSCGQ